MNLNKQLALGIKIAVHAHEGQFDRGGKPYILHPLHLMNQLMFDLELATIAVMHDVIEDSNYDFDDLIKAGFSERVVRALKCLTHLEEHNYFEYIEIISNNYDAIRVKRKDLQHNSDITRLKGIKTKDLDRMAKYHRAFIRLGEAKETFQSQPQKR